MDWQRMVPNPVQTKVQKSLCRICRRETEQYKRSSAFIVTALAFKDKHSSECKWDIAVAQNIITGALTLIIS